MTTTSIGSSGVTFPDSTTLASAGGIIPGLKSQIFNSSGTFTVPTGVTAIKVTCVGGGGGAGNNAGGNGNAGGATTFSNVSANGGNGGAYSGGAGNPGNGGGSSLAFGFTAFTAYQAPCNGTYVSTPSPSGPFTYSNNVGTGAYQGCTSAGHCGGGGGVGIGYLTGLTPGSNISVTVGAAGNNASYTSGSKAGAVIVEW